MPPEWKRFFTFAAPVEWQVLEPGGPRQGWTYVSAVVLPMGWSSAVAVCSVFTEFWLVLPCQEVQACPGRTRFAGTTYSLWQMEALAALGGGRCGPSTWMMQPS